ncbi:uncharacterized protein N7496_006158 [Penicillium cataractarum]|uniref:Uncharacterized protein n=1 Tax=Penicillium cataractarum TaxID=2100454 RepID=A0A9W9S121_9EURO|nr:uncharacterized protein N7496_006158 [Penicillium cataractarum]KAJ5370066.1 hypothetical protein N7496_006158 [Penicillium cataractarum]
MSSRRPDNNPSSSHQPVPARGGRDNQGSSGDQRLAYYRSNTSRLLEFLKQSDQDSLDRFISVVRSGASHDDIFATIEQLFPGPGQADSQRNGLSR